MDRKIHAAVKLILGRWLDKQYDGYDMSHPPMILVGHKFIHDIKVFGNHGINLGDDFNLVGVADIQTSESQQTTYYQKAEITLTWSVS